MGGQPDLRDFPLPLTQLNYAGQAVSHSSYNQQKWLIIMREKQIEITTGAADSSPITETMQSNSLLTRREMLGITAMAGLAALTGIAPDAVAQTAQ